MVERVGRHVLRGETGRAAEAPERHFGGDQAV